MELNGFIHFYRLKAGAILADEMGLGKTIQVMGLISRVYENSKNIKPILIICPLSVMDNWKTEILKYTNFVFEEFWEEGKESFSLILQIYFYALMIH